MRGQQPYIKNYSVDEGLPSSYLYKVLSDKDGFMWFAAGTGVSRYNGVTFNNFNSNNEFPCYGAFNMGNDSRGRLWFNTFDDKVCYYLNQQFFSFPTRYPVSWFCFGKNDNNYFLTTNGHVLHYRADVLVSDTRVCDSKLFMGVCGNNNDLIIYSTVDGYFRLSDDKVTPLKSRNNDNRFSRLFKLNDGQVITTNKNGIFRIVDTGFALIYPFTKKSVLNEWIIDIYKDKNGTYWVCAETGLYQIIPESATARLVLKKSTVTSIAQDRDGNFWISTFSSGAYMFRYSTVYNTYFENAAGNGILKVTGYAPDSVFAFYINGPIKKVEITKNEIKLTDRYKHENGSVFRIFRDFNGGFIIQTGGGFFRFNGRKTESCDAYRILCEGRDTTLYLLDNQDDIKKYIGGQWQMHAAFGKQKTEEKQANGVYNAMAVTKTTIWLGNDAGLFQINDSAIIRPFSSQISREYIHEMLADKFGTVWVATQNKGIYYVNNNKIVPLTKADGIYATICNDLFCDEDGNVWLSAAEGLFKIVTCPTGKLRVLDFSINSLIPKGGVRTMFKYKDKIIFTSYKGLHFFDEIAELDTIPAPGIVITGVTINNRDTAIGSHYDLRYSQNNISIAYTSLSFSWNKKPKYYYCLAGKDSVWKSSNEFSVNFLYLKPGAYRFYVVAENIDGKRSEAAMVQFSINLPYWQTWWFYTTFFLLVSLLSMFIIRHYRSISKKEKLYIENELKALRAQMNPHFIFNALNAIQDFTLQNDKPKANYYLVQFAKLMRGLLENSRKSIISLQQELQFLELYLEIEMVRFENKFAYTITIDNQIEPDLSYIPSMILQPFVENAINHGLAPAPNGGILKLTIEKHGDSIKCIIEDNGVGRSHKKTSTHESTGILTTESRLRLLNQPGTNSITVTDLTDTQGNPAGTKVELWIKLPENKEHSRNNTY